jgi:putative ABC transport system permease protein
MDHPIDVGWLQLATALVLVAVALALSSWQRLGLGKSIVVGAIRATVQLVAIGYVLLWLFAADRWYYTLALMIVMVIVATFTATDRQSDDPAVRKRLRPILGVAILAGAVATIAYVTVVVVQVTPWYSPRYLIPLFGMIVANAMNTAALAAERLGAEMEARRGEIEAYLAIGASPMQASAEPVRKALTAAMIPAVNGLAVVGVVALPGMMTGQILAGASPILAVRYQLVVVFMLTAASAITAAVAMHFYRRTFFSPAEQLLPKRPV